MGEAKRRGTFEQRKAESIELYGKREIAERDLTMRRGKGRLTPAAATMIAMYGSQNYSRII